MENNNAPRPSYNWEVERAELMMKCGELESQNRMLRDEIEKANIRLEVVLKEKSNVEGKVAHLEGQIEAYKYCIDSRR